jgi:hypothetical protein
MNLRAPEDTASCELRPGPAQNAAVMAHEAQVRARLEERERMLSPFAARSYQWWGRVVALTAGARPARRRWLG